MDPTAGVAQSRRGFGQKAAVRARSGIKALPRSSGQGVPKPGIETRKGRNIFFTIIPPHARSTLAPPFRFSLVSSRAPGLEVSVVLVRQLVGEEKW